MISSRWNKTMITRPSACLRVCCYSRHRCLLAVGGLDDSRCLLHTASRCYMTFTIQRDLTRSGTSHAVENAAHSSPAALGQQASSTRLRQA